MSLTFSFFEVKYLKLMGWGVQYLGLCDALCCLRYCGVCVCVWHYVLCEWHGVCVCVTLCCVQLRCLCDTLCCVWYRGIWHCVVCDTMVCVILFVVCNNMVWWHCVVCCMWHNALCDTAVCDTWYVWYYVLFQTQWCVWHCVMWMCGVNVTACDTVHDIAWCVWMWQCVWHCVIRVYVSLCECDSVYDTVCIRVNMSLCEYKYDQSNTIVRLHGARWKRLMLTTVLRCR